ncbi:hypothetical protein [Acinetobacter gyllenbergii]|uniref:hypothetical protein n=1 Tax=Acinetobacter gyllenbergii TaxID=134534 RepID=UPI000806A4B6|nr:hypothetical protein [Acinetobacter gyllenbergii]
MFLDQLNETYSEEIKIVNFLFSDISDCNKVWNYSYKGFLFEFFHSPETKKIYLKKFIQEVEYVLNDRKRKVYELQYNLKSEKIDGKFLKFNPSATMYDGIVEQLTDGLFDECDVPAPELWLGIQNNSLISFIPKKYIGIVSIAVENSLGQSLEWISTMER